MATGLNVSTSTNISSEELYDITCTRCAKKKLNTAAVEFCLECREYFCSGCTEMHNSFPLLAGHVLEKAKLNSMDKTYCLPCIPTERCQKHPTEIIKIYCEVHDQVACIVCTTIDHKACKDIHYIPDVAGTLYTKQMNTDTISALLKASDEVRSLTEMYNKALTDLNTAKQTTLQEIQKFREELNQMLDKLEEKTKQELDDQYQTLQSNWQALIENATPVLHTLQKHLHQLQSPETNTSQQFVLIKMSKEGLSSLADTVTRQLLPSSVQITFSQSQAIKSCFEQLSSLGYISHHIGSRKQGLYKVKESRKHTVRIKSDTNTCYIWGSCVLDSGHLLLADSSNNKLKLFDTKKNAVTSDCALPESPRAVCIVSNVEAAVCLCNNWVQFVSISNGLLPTRRIQINHECRGLAIVGDSMYITSKDNLYAHTVNGKLLKTINKNQSGQTIFTDTYHLTVSNNGNIHVADYNYGLITLDTQGLVLWKYSGSDLIGAQGVCTDGCANVFVCGYRSCTVLQLGHDGQRLGELCAQGDRASRPTSLLFDKKNCRLIISDAADDCICMFSFE